MSASNVLDTPSQMRSMSPANHLIGWVAIVCERDCDIEAYTDFRLDSFVGNYGLTKIIVTHDRFEFGLLKPSEYLRLTTWSVFHDCASICFIEGTFYDASQGHQALTGEDPSLAKLLVQNFRAMKERAIEGLSGSFSVFIFDFENRQLLRFVDRLGTKVLYWSFISGDLIVSSNLAVFRTLQAPEVDQTAALQFLTIGFPIGERTLFKGVKIQLPASANVFRGSSMKSIRYWTPQRVKNGLRRGC